jgi:membrane protease YdiL (CAAX protease family)
LFHLDLWRLPEILVIGAFLGYLAYRSGSLIPPFLAHALSNTISIVMVAAGNSGAIPASGDRPWTIPFSVMLLALALILLHRAPAGRPRNRMI